MSYVLCLLIVIWPIACVSRGTRVASQPHRKHLSCAAMLPSNDHSVWRIKMSSSRHQHEPSQRRWCWLGYDVVCVVVFDDAPESIIFWLKTYHEPCFTYSHIYSLTRRFRACAWTTQMLWNKYVFATQVRRRFNNTYTIFHHLCTHLWWIWFWFLFVWFHTIYIYILH